MQVNDRQVLDEIRTRMGMTQRALAEQSGISRSTVAKLELGLHKPSPQTLTQLAGILGEQVYRAKYGWRKTYVKRGRPRRDRQSQS
jgi:transcriptional regulator with XRE-family HTH domain